MKYFTLLFFLISIGCSAGIANESNVVSLNYEVDCDTKNDDLRELEYVLEDSDVETWNSRCRFMNIANNFAFYECDYYRMYTNKNGGQSSIQTGSGVEKFSICDDLISYPSLFGTTYRLGRIKIGNDRQIALKAYYAAKKLCLCPN